MNKLCVMLALFALFGLVMLKGTALSVLLGALSVIVTLGSFIECQHKVNIEEPKEIKGMWPCKEATNYHIQPTDRQ